MTKVVNRNESFERIYRNTNFDAQQVHQSVFMSAKKTTNKMLLNNSLMGSRNLKSDLSDHKMNTLDDTLDREMEENQN